jgi:hypothetical protein
MAEQVIASGGTGAAYCIYCIALRFTAKKESAMERQLKEEEKILESVAEKKALMGVAELAKGIQYEDPIKTR